MFLMRVRFVVWAKAVAAAAVVMGGATAHAQTLECATVSTGGGVLDNGSVVIIGQAVVGTMTSAQYTIEVGAITCLAATGCTEASQCDDGVFCTSDACDGGSCVNDPIIYGDVNDSGVVNLDDILCVIAGFGDYDNCPTADIAGCEANGVINLDDILAIIGAFGGDDPCCG